MLDDMTFRLIMVLPTVQIIEPWFLYGTHQIVTTGFRFLVFVTVFWCKLHSFNCFSFLYSILSAQYFVFCLSEACYMYFDILLRILYFRRVGWVG